MSLRIASGRLRGRKLASPPTGVRPTGARQREALFAIWGARVEDARVLDLFAGSGIMGLEAFSRGAAQVTFVDAGARVVRQLTQTLRAWVDTSSMAALSVRRGHIPQCLRAWPATGSDLVFADPPYAWSEWPALLGAASAWLAEDGELAIEHSTRIELPTDVVGLTRFDRRTWGESAISRYRAGGAVE